MANRYRPSPLIRGIGPKMLPIDHQRGVHDKIATELASRNPIDAGEIDAILLHGLSGASQRSLVKLSAAINFAGDETRHTIAKHLVVFPALRTSKPIYPEHLPTAIMLRLAQLRLVTATDKRPRVSDVVRALLSEIDTLPDSPMRLQFESAALSAALNNLGISGDLSNWVSLLSRFRRYVRTGHEEVFTHDPQIPPTAVLFSAGIAGLDSVKKLEAIFDALSRLDDDERHEFLTPIDPSVQDYHILVHHPWTAQSRQPGFDAAEAIDSYVNMAIQADSWGLRTLSVQCRVAVAMILDEHVGDTERALDVVEDAARTFGPDALLVRAFAKLHRRIGHGTEALAYFRDAVSQVSTFGSVDAVYTVRDAAVCAAECGEWDTARTWFLHAQAASDPLHGIGRGAISVGLRADAAVASFQAGDLQDAVTLMKDALLSLPEFEPDSNLQAVHCHRVIRHAILWLEAKVEGRDIKIDGKPIAMLPGACSNPEPVPEIEQLPLGHIDFAWYMLAEIELANGLDAGVREVVEQFGTQGYIPFSEHMFRTHVLGVTITAQDPSGFSMYFLHYLASATYCVANRSAISRSFSVLDPERVAIPVLPHKGPYNPATELSARHAVLAYGVRSLLDGGIGAIDQLRDALRQELGESHLGRSLFDRLDAASTDGKDLDSELTSILGRFFAAEHPPPGLIFRSGIRLLAWIAESHFKSILIPHLKPWLMAHWARILQTQRFLLRSPATTIPPIVEVLRSGVKGERFAAQLTLVAEVAVGGRLDATLRQNLERLAHGEEA